MQWLIDIVKDWIESVPYATEAWVEAKNYLTTGYVDRGDPAVPDLNTGDLDKDGTWHTLDLSSVVPAGAKAVHLYLILFDDAVGSLISFRKNGNNFNSNISVMSTTVASVIEYGEIICALDSGRNLQYKVSNVTWLAITVTIKGWWL